MPPYASCPYSFKSLQLYKKICYNSIIFRYVCLSLIFRQQNILSKHRSAKESVPVHVIFYETENGTVPAKDFIFSLDPKLKAKVLYVIDKLESRGSKLRLPDSKELSDGIFELRAISGSNIARVLYFFIIGNTAVLTNGFIKKTRKTPLNQILLAKNTATTTKGGIPYDNMA